MVLKGLDHNNDLFIKQTLFSLYITLYCLWQTVLYVETIAKTADAAHTISSHQTFIIKICLKYGVAVELRGGIFFNEFLVVDISM